jgi:hypothetical protein
LEKNLAVVKGQISVILLAFFEGVLENGRFWMVFCW